MTDSAPKYHLEQIYNPEHAHPDEAHSVLMRLIPEKSRVLELGCASGYLSGYMEKMLGCTVTGLEADSTAVAIAQTRCKEVHHVDLDMLDALKIAESGAPYDVLLAAAVLEHLKYPENLLKQAHTLLAPNAIVIVSLPNIAYWAFRLKHLAGKFDYVDYGVMDRTHLHLYTVKTGRELLESAGYRVEKLFTAGSLFQNIANAAARKLHRNLPPAIMPNLSAYELIFIARPKITTH